MRFYVYFFIFILKEQKQMATPSPLDDDFMEVFSSKQEKYDYRKKYTSTMTPEDILVCEKCEKERFLHPYLSGSFNKGCLKYQEKTTYTTTLKKATFSMTRFVRNKVMEVVQTVRENIVNIMCVGLPTVVYYLDESKDFGKREMYTTLALSGLICLNVANRYKFSKRIDNTTPLYRQPSNFTITPVSGPITSLPSVSSQAQQISTSAPPPPPPVETVGFIRGNMLPSFDKSFEMPSSLTGSIDIVNVPEIEQITPPKEKKRFYFW
jgi:hypothetical protein